MQNRLVKCSYARLYSLGLRSSSSSLSAWRLPWLRALVGVAARHLGTPDSEAANALSEQLLAARLLARTLPVVGAAAKQGQNEQETKVNGSLATCMRTPSRIPLVPP